MKKNYYTYILECSDKTLYTWWTNNLERRIDIHNEGKWAKYTRWRTPIKLVYFEEYITENEARKRECAIKKLGRKEKIRLIHNHLL